MDSHGYTNGRTSDTEIPFHQSRRRTGRIRDLLWQGDRTCSLYVVARCKTHLLKHVWPNERRFISRRHTTPEQNRRQLLPSAEWGRETLREEDYPTGDGLPDADQLKSRTARSHPR